MRLIYRRIEFPVAMSSFTLFGHIILARPHKLEVMPTPNVSGALVEFFPSGWLYSQGRRSLNGFLFFLLLIQSELIQSFNHLCLVSISS